MIHTAKVYLWGSRIGIIHQSDNDAAATFEYDKKFQQSNIQLSPFKMPLSERIYSFPELSRTDAFHGLPGLLADSLPDKFGNAVIDKWLSHNGRATDSFTAIERLCYTGNRGMGALEYRPANDPEHYDDNIDITEMTKLASEILSNKSGTILNDKNANITQLMEIGSSAGGARAKAIIAWNEKTGEIKSGQIDAGNDFDYWLIKFDGVTGNGDHNISDQKQYTLIEYAYYLMACDLGITMEECRILKKDGLNHFITKRFDRLNGDKLHMQTLAALGHFDYNIPNQCSYEIYANFARKLKIGRTGMEQIFKRAVFNVLAGNCDDHVKNFSFLMDRKGKWNISPAYDLTFAYNPINKWISQHQMSLSGKTYSITKEDIIQFGKNIELPALFCDKVYEDTKNVVTHWLEYAEKCGLTEQRALEINEKIKQANYL